jgi:hypothetical protein
MSTTTVRREAELATARALLAYRAERAAHAAGYTHVRIRPLRATRLGVEQPSQHVRVMGEVLGVR